MSKCGRNVKLDLQVATNYSAKKKNSTERRINEIEPCIRKRVTHSDGVWVAFVKWDAHIVAFDFCLQCQHRHRWLPHFMLITEYNNKTFRLCSRNHLFPLRSSAFISPTKEFSTQMITGIRQMPKQQWHGRIVIEGARNSIIVDSCVSPILKSSVAVAFIIALNLFVAFFCFFSHCRCFSFPLSLLALLFRFGVNVLRKMYFIGVFVSPIWYAFYCKKSCWSYLSKPIWWWRQWWWWWWWLLFQKALKCGMHIWLKASCMLPLIRLMILLVILHLFGHVLKVAFFGRRLEMDSKKTHLWRNKLGSTRKCRLRHYYNIGQLQHNHYIMRFTFLFFVLFAYGFFSRMCWTHMALTAQTLTKSKARSI